eukprot:6143865-Amphidinium_carterae.1
MIAVPVAIKEIDADCIMRSTGMVSWGSVRACLNVADKLAETGPPSSKVKECMWNLCKAGTRTCLP